VPVVLLQGPPGAYIGATCGAAGHLEELSRRKLALQELAPSLVLLVTDVLTYCAQSQLQMCSWRWSTSPILVVGSTLQSFFLRTSSVDTTHGASNPCSLSHRCTTSDRRDSYWPDNSEPYRSASFGAIWAVGTTPGRGNAPDRRLVRVHMARTEGRQDSFGGAAAPGRGWRRRTWTWVAPLYLDARCPQSKICECSSLSCMLHPTVLRASRALITYP